MTPAPSSVPFFSHRLLVALILFVGLVISLVSYRLGRASEHAAAKAEFLHRATLRHALVREILGRYEDALFGLSTLFMAETEVSRSEFMRATARLEDRIMGAQAFEWVPVVTHDQRVKFESSMEKSYGRRSFQITEYDARGQARAAAKRPFYYPISFVQPLRGNEAALGYDLTTGPTYAVLEHARATRQVLVTHQIRLVQERGNEFGVIMILPVYRAGRASAAQNPATGVANDVFTGFVQCVFRVSDLLETAHSRQPSTILDMLFIDASETDPARRTLYYRPANKGPGQEPMMEAEFRRGLSREFKIPFGQRDWRVQFRPRAGWVEESYTSMPLLRSGSLLLLSALVAGMIHLVGRRTQTVRREVDERTAELAESRRQLASMLHALPGMAYRCTYDDQITVIFVSEGARELTGWTAEEFLAGAVHFRDLIHPDDLGRVRDGTRIALQDQSDVEVEYRIRTRSGVEKWVLSRGRGVYTTDGKLDVFEGLAIDITAQKGAETARLSLERKLLEGQKLESLGLLAGGIAHDFNNLLSTILGNATMARVTLPMNNSADGQLRAIEAASLRAAELCRQMLAYAGKGRFVVEPINLTALSEDLLPLLKISIAHQAALNLKLARDLPPVLADATQIRQIVMNLVVNAADAIADRGGEIVLTTGVMVASHAMLAGCVAGADLPTGDYVFVEVRDNGIGMSAEVLAKIFDPFFTTKFAGRGLGLAAVLGIVRGHHGALRVESTPGLGSSFRLLMSPVRAATPAGAAGPGTSVNAERWQRTGTILVIEDEEPVRVVTMEMLRLFGFTPIGAADGLAGLEKFRENPSAVDLVLLDLLMPGMSGEQVFRELRAIRTDVRVLLVSGFNEGDIVRRLGDGPGLGFIAKPFTREAFERALRAVFEGSP
jgi:two-component system, cell cycle sensor histidine kinase and response regulator CckA